MIAIATMTLFAILSIAVFAICFALIIKLWSANHEARAEMRRYQGGFMSFWNGRLNETPDEFGDYRILRGLEWDQKKKTYIPQSALSSEGLRSAYPK